MYVITAASIDALFEEVEKSTPDLTPTVRKDDYVVLTPGFHAPAYADGHVIDVNADGFILAYGTRDCPQMFRMYMYGMQQRIGFSHVAEVWRKVDVVKREQFTTEDGRTCAVQSLEYEWVRVL